LRINKITKKKNRIFMTKSNAVVAIYKSHAEAEAAAWSSVRSPAFPAVFPLTNGAAGGFAGL
jgi:hypothetical protein